MFKFWKKDKDQPQGDTTSPSSSSGASEGGWDPQATQALNQAVSQAPVPALLKNRLKNELKKAAEAEAKKAGHKKVTPEDLMNGLMSKLPDSMKGKIEAAMKEGPEGMKKLQKELGEK